MKTNEEIVEEFEFKHCRYLPSEEDREYGDMVLHSDAETITTWLRTTLEEVRREEREACAVTVWNYLATFTDCLEPTQRTNALNQAIKLIRKRTPTKTDKQEDYKE